MLDLYQLHQGIPLSLVYRPLRSSPVGRRRTTVINNATDPSQLIQAYLLDAPPQCAPGTW